MQLLVSFVICAFLAVNIHGTKQNSSQQSCTVGRVCGVLENVLRKQSYLEKKVKEHDKILGGKGCRGKIVVEFRSLPCLYSGYTALVLLGLSYELYSSIFPIYAEGGTPAVYRFLQKLKHASVLTAVKAKHGVAHYIRGPKY